MAWILNELDRSLVRGEPTPALSSLRFTERCLAEEEIDELTKTRALKPMVNINHRDMKFQITCHSDDIEKAKDILSGFIERETLHWHEYYLKIAHKTNS